MSRFSFSTDEPGEYFCTGIAREMRRLFGISQEEAVARIDRHLQGQEIQGSDDLIYHEDELYWAKVIYYGPNACWWSEWWLAEHTLAPLPTPEFRIRSTEEKRMLACETIEKFRNTRLDDMARNGHGQLLARSIAALDEAALDPLLDALRDPDPSMRAWTALALGKLEDTRAVEPLIARLSDPASEVRACAAEALGRIGHRAAVPALLTCLPDVDAGVRREAVAALGMLGEASAFEPLASMLEDSDTGVQEATIRGLGMLRDPRAFEILVRLFADHRVERRILVLEAFSLLGDARAIPIIEQVYAQESGVKKSKATPREAAARWAQRGNNPLREAADRALLNIRFKQRSGAC